MALIPADVAVASSLERCGFRSREDREMARRVTYPAHIEPLVHFVEETPPERIVASGHEKLASGVSTKEMLLASALAVGRPSDLPPGDHGGPVPPPAGPPAAPPLAPRPPGDVAPPPVPQTAPLRPQHH